MTFTGLVSALCSIMPRHRFPKEMSNELEKVRQSVKQWWTYGVGGSWQAIGKSAGHFQSTLDIVEEIHMPTCCLNCLPVGVGHVCRILHMCQRLTVLCRWFQAYVPYQNTPAHRVLDQPCIIPSTCWPCSKPCPRLLWITVMPNGGVVSMAKAVVPWILPRATWLDDRCFLELAMLQQQKQVNVGEMATPVHPRRACSCATRPAETSVGAANPILQRKSLGRPQAYPYNIETTCTRLSKQHWHHLYCAELVMSIVLIIYSKASNLWFALQDRS